MTFTKLSQFHRYPICRHKDLLTYPRFYHNKSSFFESSLQKRKKKKISYYNSTHKSIKMYLNKIASMITISTKHKIVPFLRIPPTNCVYMICLNIKAQKGEEEKKKAGNKKKINSDLKMGLIWFIMCFLYIIGVTAFV